MLSFKILVVLLELVWLPSVVLLEVLGLDPEDLEEGVACRAACWCSVTSIGTEGSLGPSVPSGNIGLMGVDGRRWAMMESGRQIR